MVAAKPSARDVGTTPGNAACRPRAVGLRVGDVADPWRDVLSLNRVIELGLEHADQREEVGPSAVGEVHGLGVGVAPAHRVGDHGGNRVDEGEVAALGAVAVHREWTTGEGGVDEGRHDGGVRVTGGLARAEDVEEPQRQRGQAEAVGVGVRVCLRRQLAGCVR